MRYGTHEVWGMYSRGMGYVLTGYGVCTHRVWGMYSQGMGFVLTRYGVSELVGMTRDQRVFDVSSPDAVST